jgi:hypothetical protein
MFGVQSNFRFHFEYVPPEHRITGHKGGYQEANVNVEL